MEATIVDETRANYKRVGLLSRLFMAQSQGWIAAGRAIIARSASTH